jgi:hypothetical protein
MVPRCVLVERPTEYADLLARHGTREQARFFLAQRGRSLDEVYERDQAHRRHHAGVMGAIPPQWRRASIQRADLDRFLFEPDDVVVVLGQDGLVANVAKYLAGQAVIGLNPQPEVNAGVLVPHDPAAAGELLRDMEAGRDRTQARTMACAAIDDGQRLIALNEIFVGHVSHQSARYTIGWAGRRERQSSSGVVIATGTGATGWAASLHRERRSELTLPLPAERGLAFFVREPWPSVSTGTTVTEGLIGADDRLELQIELGEGGVVFGDGIEADRIRLDWGQRVTVAAAKETLNLVI